MRPETWLYLCMMVSFVQSVTATDVIGICDKQSFDAGGVNSEGEIVSPGYPYSAPLRDSKQPLCRMTITACQECVIRIQFDEINFPSCPMMVTNAAMCIAGCDHLLVYDLNYPVQTTRAVYDTDQGHSFVSLSNRVYLTFCHSQQNQEAYKRFRISFKLTEKYTLITGQYGDDMAVGYFTSPNFPQYYALNREIYFYHLKNTDPNGSIRLSFDDWILSPNSKMTIYFNNASAPEVYLTRMGNGERPFVFSRGPYLYLRFETGEDTIYNHNFVGFKAKYEFVQEETWPDKPLTVCGDYFYDLYAGHFSFDSNKCFPGDQVDCLWMVRKKKDAALYSIHTHVNLQLKEVNLLEGQDQLQIRGGNNSASPLLTSFVANNLTGTELIQTEAFYIHLSTHCSDNRKFKVVFTSFAYAGDKGCAYYYHFQCSNGRCIFDQLRCDGIDHCGDMSDEINCPNTTYRKCLQYRSCEDGHGYFCPTEFCDQKWDCADGSDEKYCSDLLSTVRPPSEHGDINLHTFIPVSMVLILLAIAACVTISFCIRVKRTRQFAARNQQPGGSGGLVSTFRSLLPGSAERSRPRQNGTRLNINVEIQHYPDSPPSYTEAMRYDAYFGVCNFGYEPTEPIDPPPYTATPTDPLPIRYPLQVQGQLQGHGDLGWEGSGHVMAPPTYQESTRRERRRRHANYDPNRRQRGRRGQSDTSGENRPRESRHRQRRHRSQPVSRPALGLAGYSCTLPDLTEQIFIDAPPWSRYQYSEVTRDPHSPLANPELLNGGHINASNGQRSDNGPREPNYPRSRSPGEISHGESPLESSVERPLAELVPPVCTNSSHQQNCYVPDPDTATTSLDVINFQNRDQRSASPRSSVSRDQNLTPDLGRSRSGSSGPSRSSDLDSDLEDEALKQAAASYISQMFTVLAKDDPAQNSSTDTLNERPKEVSHNAGLDENKDSNPAKDIVPQARISSHGSSHDFYDNPVFNLTGAENDDTSV